MKYPTTERQRRLLALAEPLAQRFAARAMAHDADGSFPFENFDDLRDAGLTALTVPETYGGLGADELDYALTLERLAWGDASTALALGMSLSNIGQLVEGNLWPERLPALLREVVAEGATLNAAQAEPDLGSPSYGGLPATTARRDPETGGWRINGRKIYTTGAPVLRYFVTLATVEEEGQPTRLGSFLIPNDAPGVRVERTWDAMALRASGSDDLLLDDARLPADALLDARPVGAPDPRAALGLPWGSLTLAAVYTGVARAARDEIARFAATRKPTALGKPLGELPTVRLRLGEIESLLLVSERMMYGLAEDWVTLPTEARPDLRQQLPLMKSVTTNNAVRVTDLALRTAGGSGLQRGRLERLFRDARAGLINAPVDDVILQNAGKAAVDHALTEDAELAPYE